MPERPLVDVVGAVDIHVHSAPSYTHRRPWDDVVTARQGLDEGMAAIVLKDHTECTVTRAALAQKAVPGIRMFGGVVLNHSVGGINPDAADFACTMGGVEVWCPTVDALRHSQVFPQGNYATAADIGPAEPPKKSRHILKKPPISLLKDGALTDEIKDVVKICQIWDVMLGTSHIHKNEMAALAKFAKQEGFCKLVITHGNWLLMSELSDAEMRELADLGAWIEFCGTSLLPPHGARSMEAEVKALYTVGLDRCILASDAGGQTYGSAPSVFRAYLQLLLNTGLPLKDIRVLSSDRPKQLLHMS
jgi:Family of unknown function (DUF6282)